LENLQNYLFFWPTRQKKLKHIITDKRVKNLNEKLSRGVISVQRLLEIGTNYAKTPSATAQQIGFPCKRRIQLQEEDRDLRLTLLPF
jgi:hypothetical protein